MGLVWSVPVPSKEMTGREQSRWGIQNRFWGGVLWYVFPSPEFSTPLCFLLSTLGQEMIANTIPKEFCFCCNFEGFRAFSISGKERIIQGSPRETRDL